MTNDDAIVKRLNVLIRLMLDQQIAEKRTMRKEQLVLMDSAGLSTGEIASILGRALKDVSSHLKQVKKEIKSKKTKEIE